MANDPIAAGSLSQTGKDSITDPLGQTWVRLSVDSRQGGLSSTFTTNFSGTNSGTDSSGSHADRRRLSFF